MITLQAPSGKYHYGIRKLKRKSDFESADPQGDVDGDSESGVCRQRVVAVSVIRSPFAPRLS